MDKQQPPPDAPPAYDELQQQHGYAQDGSIPQYQNSQFGNALVGPNGYPDEKKQNPNFNQNGAQQEGNSGMYTVPPEKVNITMANPEHLNPQYQEYLQRDQERVKHGDYPKGPEFYGRKGAPLAPSHKGKEKTGGSSFPGRGGASYHNAANQ